MNQISLLLGRTAGRVIRGEELQLNNPERIRLLAVANSLGIMHLMYNRLTETLAPDMIPVSSFKQEMETVFQNTAQADMWVKMQNAFEENGVDILMLKGIQLRELYPEPESREMCDIDLMYKYKQKKAVKKVMAELGFKFAFTDTRHIKFYNVQSVTVEMHHTIRQEHNFYNSYFDRLFERAAAREGFSHIYCMNLTDLYIHTLLHLYDHIRSGEYALRRLCDVYMLSLKLDTESAEITDCIASFGMTEFVGKISKICRYIFDGETVDDDTATLADAFFGIFTETNSDISVTENEISSFKKFKYYLSELFPKPAKIYNAFPWTFYHKFLLPSGYIIRIFQGLGARKKNAETKLKNAEKEIRRRESEFARKFGIEP